ncbi:MAG: tRNA uridine-5-carboxymethylaminomethyl(34) synthesis GTPase MnmE [Vicinamibacterales bacterium]
MFSTDDTIVAIATPPGRGAIGIVRLSGPEATSIAVALTARAKPFEPRHATFASVSAGDVRDNVVVTWFPKPASYTGDDVVEIGAHGSAVVLEAIVSSALTAGARLAAPGEFTLRSFLNGKIDLTQAEAIADLIDAATPLQARAAFDQLSGTLTQKVAKIDAELFDLMARLEASVDFPDEGYHFIDPAVATSAIGGLVSQIDTILASARRGRLVREGAQVAIVGQPNVGKSSLFNALVGSHRAIVTDIAGTTRDLLTEVVNLRGLRVTLVDTAGLGEGRDPVEREGIARARQAMRVADVVLLVCDSQAAWENTRAALNDVSPGKIVLVSSKADVGNDWCLPASVKLSAVTGRGLDDLVNRIHAALGDEPTEDTPAVSNLRHIDLLERARSALVAAAATVDGAGVSHSEEFVLADLQEARQLLETVTGRRTSDDLLVHIFQRFCVGK